MYALLCVIHGMKSRSASLRVQPYGSFRVPILPVIPTYEWPRDCALRTNLSIAVQSLPKQTRNRKLTRALRGWSAGIHSDLRILLSAQFSYSRLESRKGTKRERKYNLFAMIQQAYGYAHFLPVGFIGTLPATERIKRYRPPRPRRSVFQI